MTEQRGGKLNRLERLLPEGLLVSAAWLSGQGYSGSLRSQYVESGWLHQPLRSVYRRGRGEINWQQTVVSLQTLLEQRLVVGGRTALELQGYAHYLAHKTKTVHLYGPERPPAWLNRLPLGARFVYHHSEPLLPLPAFPHRLEPAGTAKFPDELESRPYGQWDWPLTLSCPERALLELLDELPDRESFTQVDALVEGLANLRPKLLTALLQRCGSVKVKRLFFFFADRHKHAWLARIDRSAVDLGKGKRLVVRGGVLDTAHQITVPREFHGLQ